MDSLNFLEDSLRELNKITKIAYGKEIQTIALANWEKDLRKNNPLWKYVEAKNFTLNNKHGSAHVLAMVDKRLPGIGLVGYFASTDPQTGLEVLNQGTAWLKSEHGLKDVYGPINGTITKDYRFNLKEDYLIPGEPVNPTWYIDVFKEAGFVEYNQYVSGILKHYKLFIKLFIRDPSTKYSSIRIKPFDSKSHVKELKKYHILMNAVFPSQSIYCPKLSWEERVYNFNDLDNIFDSKYCYFLEDRGKPIGFIISFPHNDQLIIKTIAILPEYRGKRLSSLLIKKVHSQASKDGLGAAVYSTVRVGNSIYKKRKPGVRIYRKYITMHKSIE
jgi:ribosomal protein S18 acetylase RimI-like enzyme